MLEKLHRNIKIMYICSVTETLSFIFAVVLIAGLAYAFVGKNLLIAVVLFVCLLFAIAGFAVAKILRKASKPDRLCYETAIKHTSLYAIAEAFSAKSVTEHACASFSERDGFDIRLLILKCDVSNRQKLREEANREIDKIYGVREKQNPPLKDIRINLYIYESGFTYDSQKAYANDTRLVDRVEPIFNFYVDLEKSTLFAPAIYGDFAFGQMNMYACAVDFLLQTI